MMKSFSLIVLGGLLAFSAYAEKNVNITPWLFVSPEGRLTLCSDIHVVLKHATPKWKKVQEQGPGAIDIISESPGKDKQNFFLKGTFRTGSGTFNFEENLKNNGNVVNGSWQVTSDSGVPTEALYLMIKLPGGYEQKEIIIDDQKLKLPAFTDHCQNIKPFSRVARIVVPGKSGKIIISGELNGLISASTRHDSFYSLRLFCSPDKGNIKHSTLDIKVSVEGYVPSANGAATVISPENSGQNLFADDGYFRGETGSLPIRWFLRDSKYKTGVGISSELGFETSDKVLLINAANVASHNDAVIQSPQMPLPDNGTFEFTVWAQPMDETAKISLFLGGLDGYKWRNVKSFQMGEGWRKYSVSGVVPALESGQKRFVCCQIIVPKGQSVAVGRMELKWRLDDTTAKASQYPVNTKLSCNLVYNPDFELGGFGWEKYFSSANISQLFGNQLSEYYRNAIPQIVDGGVDGGKALKFFPPDSPISFSFPVVIGKEYTISAYMKCATSGKTTSCDIAMVADNMKQNHRKFQVTDQWRRYSFTAAWDHVTVRKNAYIRIHAEGPEPVLLDRVQAEQGELSPFSAFPVQLSLVTAPGQEYNIYPDTDRGAEMILKAVCCPEVKGPVKIKADIVDAWGNPISSHRLQAEASPVLTFPVKVNTAGQRGVFHVTLKAFDQKDSLIGGGISCYAVCRNLSDVSLPDNPIAGHFELWRDRFAYPERLMPVLKNYFPINKFNRCFFQYLPEHLQNPQFVTEFEEMTKHWTWPSSVARVWCMGRYSESFFGKDITLTKNLSPDHISTFKNKLSTLIVSKLKTDVKYWELINEPYGWRLENGEKSMEPEKVAQLYKAAYEVIKSVNPEIKLLGPCIALGYDDWTERFLKAGGGKWIDVFTVHGYCGNADTFDTYGKLGVYRNMLDRYGRRDLKIWNTEQYFGVRVPYREMIECELIRDYYSDTMLDHASEIVSNLIHHAAAGVPIAAFAFDDTVFDGLGKEFFIYDYFAAANCAAEFLGQAGTGVPVEMGGALKCFLFSEAKNGALVTIHAINQGETGTICLPQTVQAYDMMGNRLIGEKLTLGHSIVYLRFPEGMSKREVVELLCHMELLGFGKAFSLAVAMADKNTLAVSVNNRLNRPASGSVALQQYPEGWKFAVGELPFSGLKPGDSTTLRFRINSSQTRPLGVYPFKLKVKTEKESFTEDVKLSSLYTKYAETVTGDGNLDAWKDIERIPLGEDNLSKKFSMTQDWTGPKDLSAELMVAWNQKGLGIGIIVTDDHFCFADFPAESWHNDSVQLYFDMKNDADQKSKNATDDASYQISFNGKNAAAYLDKAPSGRFIGEANRQEGIDADVKVTCRKLGGDRLFYDIFLPCNVLPTVAFKAGTSLGFSLLVNDNDGKGRKTGLTLAPKGKEPYNAPDEYIDLILQK